MATAARSHRDTAARVPGQGKAPAPGVGASDGGARVLRLPLAPRAVATPDRVAQHAVPRWRLALLLTVLMSIGAALSLVPAGDLAARDAELAWLLRAMTLIKASAVAAALGALAWRLNGALRRQTGIAYLLGAALLTGGWAALWQLNQIALAALVFHAGLAILLITALRDTGAAQALPRARR